jgi:uncharacterized secreted protein with C-terminal beta-propeller domain
VSARFVGDFAYLTTFHQVDPLLTIDLSDPTAPTITGSLEITGYSSYMQAADSTHLLGIGRDADPKTGWTSGLQLSLFDVSDPTNPTRVDAYKFPGGPWDNYSSAEWDSHAFSYFAGQGILALPVDAGWDSQSSSGLAVFRIDLQKGITYLGEIVHDTPVQRSLRIGDLLYSLSDDQLKVNALTDPTQEFSTLQFADPPPPPTPIVVDPPVVVYSNGGPITAA